MEPHENESKKPFQLLSAGFGGQGILFIGNTLAQAVLREGKYVTFMPSYGVAMRGGTANCVVTIANEFVGSPLLDRPDAAIVMNEASLLKFQTMVRPGGTIIANSSMAGQDKYERGDEVRILWVPATEMAQDVAGTERSANMVALGAFLSANPVAEVSSVEDVIRNVEGAHKQALVEKNIAALHAGLDHVCAGC